MRGSFDRRADAFRQTKSVLCCGVGKQRHKLLTADPGEKVFGSQLRRCQTTRNAIRTSSPVPFAKLIVDSLEPIEIKHDDSDRLVAKTCSF